MPRERRTSRRACLPSWRPRPRRRSRAAGDRTRCQLESAAFPPHEPGLQGSHRCELACGLPPGPKLRGYFVYVALTTNISTARLVRRAFHSASASSSCLPPRRPSDGDTALGDAILGRTRSRRPRRASSSRSSSSRATSTPLKRSAPTSAGLRSEPETSSTRLHAHGGAVAEGIRRFPAPCSGQGLAAGRCPGHHGRVRGRLWIAPGAL